MFDRLSPTQRYTTLMAGVGALAVTLKRSNVSQDYVIGVPFILLVAGTLLILWGAERRYRRYEDDVREGSRVIRDWVSVSTLMVRRNTPESLTAHLDTTLGVIDRWMTAWDVAYTTSHNDTERRISEWEEDVDEEMEG